MAEWFSLGGKQLVGPQQTKVEKRKEDNSCNNSNCLFLLSEKEIYNTTTTTTNSSSNHKGFEIWTQSYHHSNQSFSNGFSLGVGPSCANLFDDSTRFGLTVMRSGALGGGMNCQDCGNQAKKDCAHLRCRTCCRSRGFQCQTHVKSTWVPAAKRRERQQQQLVQHRQLPGDTSKRHRETQGASAALARIPSPITTTGLELGQLPRELNSPAVFQCVRVNSMDTPEEQYAYQTAVNIGGHVFKGILYDQGPDTDPYNAGGDRSSSAAAAADADQQNLNLITAATTTAAPGSANPLPFDPSSIYPNIPLNTFMAGTQFFPPPRP